MTRAGVFALGLAALMAATGALGFYFVRAEHEAALERTRRGDEMRELTRLKLELERAHAGLEGPSQPAPPAWPPLELGPSAGSRSEREQAVLALLQGQLEARRLPVVATEPGVPFDSALRDRLAPVRYKTGASRPSFKCNCPPGDPLCSCF